MSNDWATLQNRLGLPDAGELGPLPLVHRTGKQAGAWHSLFEEGFLEPGPAGSPPEHESGRSPAAYAFLGCGAYPRGNVAILVPVAAVKAATFTPFDTGGWWARRILLDGTEPTEDERRSAYRDFVGRHSDLLAFAAGWIQALFPRFGRMGYVRSPLVSDPEQPPPTHLRSRTGHRLAWSIEVQIHHPLALDPARDRVIVARRDLIEELPDAWWGVARYDDREWDEVSFDEFVSACIEEELTRT